MKSIKQHRRGNDFPLRINKNIKNLSDNISKTVAQNTDLLQIDSISKRKEDTFRKAYNFSIIGLVFFIVPILLLIIYWIIVPFDFSTDTSSEIIKAKIARAEMRNNSLKTAVAVSMGCGVILEMIALVLFYFYGRTLSQLDMHFDMNERISLAEAQCKDFEKGNFRNKGHLIIIKSLMGYKLETSEKSKPKIEETDNFSKNAHK